MTAILTYWNVLTTSQRANRVAGNKREFDADSDILIQIATIWPNFLIAINESLISTDAAATMANNLYNEMVKLLSIPATDGEYTMSWANQKTNFAYKNL